MYKNDDIRIYNFDCITDTIVEVITTCNLKPNYSLLGRELGYDRRTIKSHYENGMPDPHRHKPSMIDAFYDIIQTLLSDDPPPNSFITNVFYGNTW